MVKLIHSSLALALACVLCSIAIADEPFGTEILPLAKIAIAARPRAVTLIWPGLRTCAW
ncbi:MAG: hypothetical protein SGI88_17805 [Candidatus Hydrogenedentes bacterium]|nr:hypothetical protein [Candidatus Hydrogenedentota bacterium]